MDDEKSKSQKKREADALQQLGTRLIEWDEEKLNRLPLTEPLLQAIMTAKKLKSHGAVRRQAQLIGKLIRSTEVETLTNAYAEILAEENAQNAAFHTVEHWRTRLIQQSKPALTEYIETYHPEDVQQLRQSIKKAIEEQQKAQNTGASRALFRLIRSQIT